MARAISKIENDSPDAREILKGVFAHGGRGLVIGITGAPGAGKSSLVDKLALAYRARASESETPIAQEDAPSKVGLRPSALIPLLLAATGFSALASFLYEIAWTRMLALVLGSASHAFELMLSALDRKSTRLNSSHRT